MKKNKVFVGPGNIAGSAMYIAKSLRIVGIDAKSFSYNAHPFGYNCDYDSILFNNPFKHKGNLLQKLIINKYSIKIIRTIQKIFIFLFVTIKYDTFIFISHETFFNNNHDLKIIKFLKKKIIFFFMGCPERDPYSNINQMDRGMCSFCKDEKMQKHLFCYHERKKRKIEFISHYADAIFAQRDTSSFIKDPLKIKKIFLSTDFRIESEDIKQKFLNDKEILVTHIPSNKLLKGTTYVFKSIDELQSKGHKFSFYSKSIDHKEVSELLRKTHILIDQFSSGHGLLSIEGMASGCVVICRMAKWFNEDYPEIPLVSCEPEDLTDILHNLLKNKELMLNIAAKTYDYYQKFHTPEKVGKYLKNTLGLN